MGGKDGSKFLGRVRRRFKRESSSPASSTQYIEGHLSYEEDVQGSRPPTSSKATAEVEPIEQQHASLRKSQALWNDAYDSLAKSEDTAKLVRLYVKTLTTALETRLSDAEISAALDDRTKRQDLMKELVEEGQAKLSKTSNVINGVSAVAQFVVSVKGIVDAAVQNNRQAALPWAGVCIGLQILMNPVKATKSNLDGIAHVVSRMRWYCALTEYLLEKQHVDETVIQPQIGEQILSLYKALLLYQMKSVCSYYRHQGYEFLRNLANLNHWDDDIQTVRAAEDVLRNDMDQYIKIKEGDTLGQLLQSAKETSELLGDLHQTLQDLVIFQKSNVDEKNKQCLRDLFVVDPQDDMKKIERNKDTMLSEANEWIFQMEEYQAFTDWSNTDSCRLLWIKGHAGTGKTMLLMGIVRELLSHSATFAPGVSHFFCQGTVKSLNTVTATLRCLIWLLLVQQPHLISHLKSKHDNAGASLFEGDSAFISLNDVFESILKDPKLSPVYLVIDALDECEQGLDDLKRLIFTSLKISDRVKWLVSSRPTVDLRAPEMEGSLVELDSQKLQNPVNAFIDHKLSILETRPGYTDDVLKQLKKEIFQRAENTFLWVALVFKELDKEDGYQIVVHGMYALEIVRETPSGLSRLYDYMMEKIEKGLRKDCEYCKNVLVATTLAFRPLTLAELRVLAQLPDSIVAAIVRKCASFLTVQDKTVYLIHQSAKDYLQENFESRLRPTGISQGHEDMAICSIQAMSSDLKQNLYDLGYGFKPKNMRPPQPDPLASIRYCCLFWIHHLDVENLKSLEHKGTLSDDGVVLTFLKEKFLNWIESLSLLGNLSDGIYSIRKLLYIVRKSNAESQLALFLEDAEKLIQSHASIIERAPLQAYASALVFTPTASKVRASQWKHRLPFIKMLAGYKTQWDMHRQTIDGYSQVTSVAFSPDNKILASASSDHMIRLWEVSTGSHQRTLEGHSYLVFSVVFSPDGSILASASQDSTIRLWEVSTGSSKRILKGQGESVVFLAFFPDGKTLASSSDDDTIRLWDVARGSCRQTMEKFSGCAERIAISPDGKILASTSNDGMVPLWDLANGRHRQSLKLRSGGRVACVAFSPDGHTLAASSSNTIQLWDTGSWSPRQTLETKTSFQPSLAFSPDSKMLAFEASNYTIQLLEMASGDIWETLAGHDGKITDIAFSPVGMTLASASQDRTIRLWDVDPRNRQQTAEERDDLGRKRYGSIAFSPDSMTLLLASDNQVEVWDTATRSCQHVVHHPFIRFPIRVVFSPDGKTAAIALRHLVQLWDTATWTCRLTQKRTRMLSHSATSAVAFSPDSKALATASQEDTIHLWLWDTTSGSTLWTLDGDKVETVAFSPDGKTLASASKSEIQLRDAVTGSHRQSLSFFGGRYGSLLAFSPDGKTLALATGGAVQFWESDQLNFEGEQGRADFQTFSPTSKTLVYASHEGALRFSRLIFNFAFSSDGAYLLMDHEPVRLLSSPASVEQRCDEEFSKAFLHFDQEWVCLNGKQLLWLPADCRPSGILDLLAHGDKGMWRNGAGRLFFLQLTCAEVMP
ncbi:WD40-repeat-containing domain protein [Trichoderma austrokoningii]